MAKKTFLPALVSIAIVALMGEVFTGSSLDYALGALTGMFVAAGSCIYIILNRKG